MSGPTMGTVYTVKIAGAPPDVDLHALRSGIDEVLARIDAQMSGYRPDSEIARFNAYRSTDWFGVSSEVAEVVGAALDVSGRSQGALDVTIAPLVEAWGFGPEGEGGSIPAAADLAALRARIGYRKLQVRLHPPALRKEIAELGLDLNAIAPGFAVDALAERLQAAGFGAFMVDIGGEIRVRGHNSRGEPWRIAVERPLDAPSPPYAILQLGDRAVATSGGYRHYLVRDGRRFAHTIDPTTAQPVSNGLASVVVVDTTAMQADAWATALTVLGSEAGYALAQREGIAALFIVRDGAALKHRATPRMQRYVLQVMGDG